MWLHRIYDALWLISTSTFRRIRCFCLIVCCRIRHCLWPKTATAYYRVSWIWFRSRATKTNWNARSPWICRVNRRMWSGGVGYWCDWQAFWMRLLMDERQPSNVLPMITANSLKMQSMMRKFLCIHSPRGNILKTILFFISVTSDSNYRLAKQNQL